MSKCGAYARSTGQPCEAPVVPKKKRCRRHGGLSTGPTRRKREDAELLTPSGGAFKVNWYEAGSWKTENRLIG
ncbi:MAG TPA: hypothetical protein EYO71_08055, partial [Rhodospirillales bacterium]|nr:hypothetical protein [Rhodospirillales bacterium]